MVKSSSKTQSVLSLSSGEAEFYAAVSSVSSALGMKSLLVDFGVELEKAILVKVDSTAALGMAGRRGAGTVRHIHTPCLWLQQAVAKGLVKMEKEPGESNLADICTKPVNQKSLHVALKACGYKVLEGKSKLALDASI